MRLFFRYLKQQKVALIAFFAFGLLFFVSFYLFALPLKAVLYPFALCLLLGCFLLLGDYLKVKRAHERVKNLWQHPQHLPPLPESTAVLEADYKALIQAQEQSYAAREVAFRSQYTDMVDYFMVWAHQIKTPIAAMDATLQQEDTPLSRKISADLFRIEQYVEMVLVFLRLDEESSDYVFAPVDLDRLVRQALRRFAGLFIDKRIRLDYRPLQKTVVSDEKWLSFVIEQVLSNALKYTARGQVRIYLEGEATLCIQDTGMGIAPEDLPRIFEKGYTGYHGRTDKKASGLGLYLCRRICKNLGHTISAKSKLEAGTTISIDLAQHGGTSQKYLTEL